MLLQVEEQHLSPAAALSIHVAITNSIAAFPGTESHNWEVTFGGVTEWAYEAAIQATQAVCHKQLNLQHLIPE